MNRDAGWVSLSRFGAYVLSIDIYDLVAKQACKLGRIRGHVWCFFG